MKNNFKEDEWLSLLDISIICWLATFEHVAIIEFVFSFHVSVINDDFIHTPCILVSLYYFDSIVKLTSASKLTLHQKFVFKNLIPFFL